MAFWTGGGAQSDGMMAFPFQSTISQGPPANTDPYHLGGRVPARWTYPYAGYGQPLLELPQNKFLRISLAMNAWLGEPIINSASKLTIFLAFEKLRLTVTGNCKKIPDWIPEDDRNNLIDKYGEDQAGTIAAAYVKQKCLELIEYLDIKTFFENVALDVLVAGDGYVNIASNATPEEEEAIDVLHSNPRAQMQAVQELQAKMQRDGRGFYDIFALQALNPSAVWLYPDYAGRIEHAKVVHLMGEGVWDINLKNLIHLKPPTFQWVIYGVSHYISALKWVDIKFKLMDALYVNAKRYVTPREWLQIQGPETLEHAMLPPTEEQMAWAEQILQAWTIEQPTVLPLGWDWKFIGAEGKVLKIEGLLEKVDDAIRTAAQVSRTFTSGAANVPAYATSKLQAGIMYKAIDPLKNLVARAIEGRILKRFCTFRGFFDDAGKVICPKVEFQTMPIQGDDSVEKKIQTLGQMSFISPITAWEFEGMDPGLEMERIAMSQKFMVEPFQSTAPNIGPSGSPDRFDETIENYVDRLGSEQAGYLMWAKSQGHKKLTNELGKVNDNSYNEGFWSAMDSVGRYLTQAAYVYRADAKNRLDHAIDWEDQIDMNKEVLMENNGNGETLNRAGTVIEEIRSSRKNGSI